MTFQSFDVYMGTAFGDSLGECFTDNCLDDRTLVYSGSDVTFAPEGGWVTIHLDREYLFAGSDSIVMEIVYSGANAGSLYCGYWGTEGFRTVYTGSQDAPIGSPERFAPHLLLLGTVRFDSVFGCME